MNEKTETIINNSPVEISPRPDGFSAEFYLAFNKELTFMLLPTS